MAIPFMTNAGIVLNIMYYINFKQMREKIFTIGLLCMLVLHASAQWSDDPAVNLQLSFQDGEQVIPKVALCPNGDYYIGYFALESGNYNVYLHRLDNSGNKLWGDNGILISSHPSMTWLTDWEITADHESHALLSWQDIRLNENNNIVAYRISPDGDFVWGQDGLQLSNSEAFDVSPKVTVTQDNNAVFAWEADGEIILQKISPAGEKLWGADGILLTHENSLTWPQLLPVGSDDIILKYFVDSGVPWAPTRHIYAQRFDTEGQPVWTNPVVISSAGTVQAWLQILPMINDGNDGFYISWHDYRISGNAATAWLQHINLDGQAVFQQNGVQLSNLDDANQFYTCLARPANDPNVYVYWNEVNGGQSLYGIFGQKVAPDGSLLWGEAGREVFPVTTQTMTPQMAFGLDEDVVLVYDHYFDSYNTSIRVVRLNSEAEFVWEPVETIVSSVVSAKVHLDASPYDGNQLVFAWEDNRDGGPHLFGQNITSTGQLGIVGSTEGTLSGTVAIENNLAEVTEVVIQIGSQSFSPQPDGSYSLILEAGSYSVTASHPFTNDFTIDNVVIVPDETTVLDIALEMKRTTMECVVLSQGEVAVEGATVIVVGPEDQYNGITNEDGKIFFEQVPYGWYYGQAYLNEPESPSYDTAIIDDSNTQLRFLLILNSLNEKSDYFSTVIQPNPIQDFSTLIIKSDKPKRYTIQIMNQTGRLIARSELTTNTATTVLLLSDLIQTKLAKGLYTLIVDDGISNQAIKFMAM